MPINFGYSQDLLLTELLYHDNDGQFVLGDDKGVESIADPDHDEEASPDLQRTKLGRGECLHHHDNGLGVS